MTRVSREATGPGAVAALLLAALASLAACAAAGPGDGDQAVPTDRIAAGAHSGLAEKRREVVRDEAGWMRLWAQIHAGTGEIPPLPVVDFSSHMLIAVATGTRPSGGFAVQVRGATARGDTLEVEVHESCPAPGAMVSLGLTQPFEVVRVPRLTQAVRFRETRSPSCR
jgi:hypothetical protein